MFDLSRYRKVVLLACTAFLSTAMLVLAQPAHSIPQTPATWTVNTTADPGAPTCAVTCSLRAAVNASAPGDIIVFNTAVFSVPQTIILSGQIEISQSLTIDRLTMGGITPTLSGNHMTRTFQVDADANVALILVEKAELPCPSSEQGSFR
jgi:CSLREA domain-containing protein